MAKISGGVKIQDFEPPLRPKKCFKQLKKWGRPKIDEKIWWGKPGYLWEGGPKMAKIEYGAEPDIFETTHVFLELRPSADEHTTCAAPSADDLQSI